MAVKYLITDKIYNNYSQLCDKLSLTEKVKNKILEMNQISPLIEDKHYEPTIIVWPIK